MSHVVIGTYERRADAERAHQAILALGLGAEVSGSSQVAQREDASDPLPEDRGIAGFIGRMFSGATGDLENIRKYEAHAQGGGVLVVARNVPEIQLEKVRAAMAGAVSVDVHGAGTTPASPDAMAAGGAAEANATSEASRHPEGNVLPNAPTGWNTPRRSTSASMGDTARDPARPAGVTSDAQGLGTDAPHTADPRTTTTGDATTEGAPDAFGHRVSNAPPDGRAVPRKN